MIWQKQEDVDLMSAERDQIVEEKLRSKYLYKLFLLIIKYTPCVLIINEILFSIFSYYLINTQILNILGCVSMINLIYLYIGSYVFKFCYLYRLCLHSIVLVNILAEIDTCVKIPISDLNILRIYLIILLIGLLSFIKFKIKDARHNKKSVSKVY